MIGSQTKPRPATDSTATPGEASGRTEPGSRGFASIDGQSRGSRAIASIDGQSPGSRAIASIDSRVVPKAGTASIPRRGPKLG
jgi:hypothetical protein